MARRLFSIRPGITFRGRKFLGVRGWSGKPTHPPLTDFPIVCYVLAAVLDVISYAAPWGDEDAVAHDFFVAGTIVIIAGAAVSLLTALTGFWDWWKGMAREKGTGILGRAQHTQVWRTANWHMTIMLTVTAIVIADVVLRLADLNDGQASMTVMVLSIAAGVLVAFGATYGGTLVFDYQFNVEPLKGSTVWNETEEDQLPGQRSAPPPPAH